MAHWLNKAHMALQKHEAVCVRTAWVCPTSSLNMLCLLAYCFCGIPKSRSRCIFNSFAYFWDTFLFLGCLVQPWYECPHLVLIFVVFSCLAVVQGRPALFWRENRRSGSQGEWKWRRGSRKSGGMGNCVWDILYERNIFSIKNGKNKEKEKR